MSKNNPETVVIKREQREMEIPDDVTVITGESEAKSFNKMSQKEKGAAIKEMVDQDRKAYNKRIDAIKGDVPNLTYVQKNNLQGRVVRKTFAPEKTGRILILNMA